MKRIIIILSILSILSCAVGYSQEKIKEGKMVWLMGMGDTSWSAKDARHFYDTNTVYFNERYMRIDISYDKWERFYINDLKNNEGAEYFRDSVQKLFIKANAVKEKAQEDTSESIRPRLTETGKTKMIAGVLCRQAIGKEEKYNIRDEVWFTNEITTPFVMDEDTPGIKGYVMEEKHYVENYVRHRKCILLERKNIDAEIFKVPKGYNVVPKVEIRK